MREPIRSNTLTAFNKKPRMSSQLRSLTGYHYFRAQRRYEYCHSTYHPLAQFWHTEIYFQLVRCPHCTFRTHHRFRRLELCPLKTQQNQEDRPACSKNYLAKEMKLESVSWIQIAIHMESINLRDFIFPVRTFKAHDFRTKMVVVVRSERRGPMTQEYTRLYVYVQVSSSRSWNISLS